MRSFSVRAYLRASSLADYDSTQVDQMLNRNRRGFRGWVGMQPGSIAHGCLQTFDTEADTSGSMSVSKLLLRDCRLTRTDPLRPRGLR